MRWVSLFVLCTATNLFSSGVASAAADGFFRISDWDGRAYWNQQEKKQLDRCSAKLTNADKITITYSLDHKYMWSLEFSSPVWNFTKGAAFPVTFRLGNRGSIRRRAVATDTHLVHVELPDSLTAFESLRSIIQFELIAGGLTSHFNLAYNNQVLTALTRCVVRYGATSRSRTAIAAWLKSSINSGSDTNIDSSIHKEASALATNIMTEVAMPNVVSLKPNEIPAGLSGDAVSKAGSILFTVSILPQDKAPEIGDLPSLIIGGDAQKCRGEFFSGAMLDVIDALRVARAYTSCQTLQAITSIYYIAIPRKQGGLYLLATISSGFEITVPGEQTARDTDSKIRASMMIALSKLERVDQ